jgi:hypothetical protein
VLKSIPAICQETFLEQELDLKQTGYVINEVLPIVNEYNDDFALFFGETKSIYAYLFNKNKKNNGKIYTREIPRKYRTIVGHSIAKDGKYNIYSSNEKRTKFLVTTFDFESEKTISKEIDWNLGDELFVQALTIKNDLVVLTIDKKNSNFSFYRFDDNFKPKKELNISNVSLANNKNKTVSIYRMLANSGFEILNKNGVLGGGANSNNLSFELIDNTVPNPLEITSKKNKLYVYKNILHFTFDQNKDVTQILTVDLNNFSWNFDIFEKPLHNAPKNTKKTNSFLFNKHLLTFALNEYGLEFRVIELETKKVIKKYSVLADEEISFSNTPIQLEVSSLFKRYREMNETKKLIRKANRTNVGIALYPTVLGFEISIGGSKEIQQQIPMMSSGIGGFGGLGGFGPSYAYAYYEGNKSIYTTGLFDSNFDHIEGSLKPTSFDLIKDYKDSKRKKPYSETIFNYKGKLIWGEHDTRNKTYILKSFIN